MRERHINCGSFGVRGVNRVCLLQSRATGKFILDYRDSRYKRRHVDLETTNIETAKRKVGSFINELKQNRRLPGIQEYREVVYVIQRGDDGPIKVGISRRLKQRVSALQTGCAEKLRVLRAYTLSDVEKAIHGELERQSRLEGEWFPAELLRTVDAFFNVPTDIALKRTQKRWKAEEEQAKRLAAEGLL